MQAATCDWQVCARTNDRLGESVVWHPIEQSLYWIDYYGPSVHRQRLLRGPVETWKLSQFETIGSLVLSEEGLILAMDRGLYHFDPRNGAMRILADPKGDRRDLVYNDSKVDRAGRYWVGTLNLAENEASSGFYRVSASGEAVMADQGFAICNGPAFSPDNRTLYFSDSMGHRILSYDLSADGSVSRRRTFHTFLPEHGLPDGVTVDSTGHVWCAMYGAGKLVCLDPNGRLILTLPIPAKYPTSICFGGPDLRTMFVTTGRDSPEVASNPKGLGGSVFMCRSDVAGLPEPIARTHDF